MGLPKPWASMFLCIAAFSVACSLDVSRPEAIGEKSMPVLSSSDALSEFSLVPVEETRLSGNTLLMLRDGDFVHPAFSPDGRKLAYSRVVVEGRTELTEVLVRDLGSGGVRVLLDPGSSKDYATYKAYVSDLEWIDEKRIEARIPDGDVDVSIVTYDAFTGEVVSRKGMNLAHENWIEMESSAEEEEFLRKAASSFPSLRRKVLLSAFEIQSAFPVPDKGYVIQKAYHGEDNHIWYLGLEHNEMVRLLALPDEREYKLVGGFVLGDSFVLVLCGPKKGHVLEYREGDVSRLAEFEGGTRGAWASFEVKASLAGRVIFIVNVHEPYEGGDNPLFVYDSSALRRVTDFPELYNIAVDPTGQRICFVVWENDQRHLIVKEYKPTKGGKANGEGA